MAAGVGEPMLADIRRQPAVLDRLLGRRVPVRAFASEHLEPGPGGCLYAVGCGDGWFAARAAAGLAETAGRAYRARAALPFLIYDAPRLTPADRVWLVSMSGNGDRTMEAVRAARSAGAPVALLTNGDGGKLGTLGLPAFSLEIEPVAPFLCGTSSYTASLLAIALVLGRAEDDRALEALVGALEGLLGAAEPAVRALARDFAGVRVLSCGLNLASADYGAAKLVEVTRLAAWSDDIEEFAHRQFWSADAGELVVYLPGNARVAGYADDSAAALADMGFTTLALELAAGKVRAAGHRIGLPPVPEPLSPLTMALPLQLLAYHLAVATGLDPNTRRHLKEDQARFTTSRALTRRSLLGTGQ